MVRLGAEALDELTAHDRAIAAAYEGVTGPLASIFSALPAEHAAQHIFLLDEAGRPVDRVHSDVESSQEEYEQHWRQRDLRMALAVANPGQVLSDVHHINPSAFERSDIYHALLRPFGVRYSLFGTTRVGRGFTLAHCLFRPPRMGAFDERDVRMMARLMPHVQRAIDLRMELGRLQSLASDLANALDLAPSPVFLLDERGEVLHQNLAAERVVAKADGLVVRLRRLVPTQPGSGAQLEATVRRVLAFAEGSRRAAGARAPLSVVQMPRAVGVPLSLVVHPLRPRNALRARGDARARARRGA